jgi:hypothetical protein
MLLPLRGIRGLALARLPKSNGGTLFSIKSTQLVRRLNFEERIVRSKRRKHNNTAPVADCDISGEAGDDRSRDWTT